MTKYYSRIAGLICLMLVFITGVSMAYSQGVLSKPDSTKFNTKLTDNRPDRPVFNSVYNLGFESFLLKMSAVRKGDVKTLNKASKTLDNLKADIQKPLDNVKIYPNPVSDQLNLTYTLKKENLVTVKVLDVLGNEVTTLMSQKMNAGQQTNTFYLNAKLNSGFYFVRVVAGADSVIKRISVL